MVSNVTNTISIVIVSNAAECLLLILGAAILLFSLSQSAKIEKRICVLVQYAEQPMENSDCECNNE